MRQRPAGYVPAAEYQARIKEALERLYQHVPVESEWYPFKGEERNMYWPVVDVAVGPFATQRRYGPRYTELMEQSRPFIQSLIDVHNGNVAHLGGNPTEFHTLMEFNENARCLLCIELEESGSRKHCLGNLVNASALGRIGLLLARTEKVLRIFVSQRAYLRFLAQVDKNTFQTANALILTTEQFDACLREHVERLPENAPKSNENLQVRDELEDAFETPTVFHVKPSPRARSNGRRSRGHGTKPR